MNLLKIEKRLCKSKFWEFTANQFLRFLTLRTWIASYTLKFAELIIANFNFASEAKCKNQNNAIFSEFTVS